MNTIGDSETKKGFVRYLLHCFFLKNCYGRFELVTCNYNYRE